MSQPKLIILKSSDGETFEVEEKVAVQSQTIKHIIEDNCTITSIPLSVVKGNVLAKIIEYCKMHVPENTGGDSLKAFDKAFVEVDQKMLFDLVLAADYLNIKGLLERICKTIAGMMRGKTPDEIREIFHIENDHTPEEEAMLRRQIAWAFD